MALTLPARRSRTRGSAPGVLPLPDLLSLLLLLVVLAPVGYTFGQLEFWRMYDQPWPAFLAGAACCGLVAMLRRPNWALFGVLLLGIGAALFALARDIPVGDGWQRFTAARTLLLDWARMVRDGQPVQDNRAVTFWTVLAAWMAGMWASWAALRAGWHWLVLALAGALLLSTISYLPGWPAAALALFTFAALLFVARVHHRRQTADAQWRGRAPQRWMQPSAALTHGAAVAAGAALLVGVAWLLPAVRWHAPSAWRPRNLSRSLGGISIGLPGARSTLHTFGSTMPFEGPISLSSDPVASVSNIRVSGQNGADLSAANITLQQQLQDQGLYLSAASYDHYDSSGWSSSATAARGGRAFGFVAGQSVYDLSVGVSTLSSQAELLSAGPPLSALRGLPGSASLPASALRLSLAPRDEIAGFVAEPPLANGSDYTTVARFSTATPDELRQAGALRDADLWVKSSYLQLPGSVTQQTRDLAAQITRDATNDYDRAAGIQAYLLSNFGYDESIPAPPPGEDGVDYLLFHVKRGYCDYFASAMAVMLRSVGVPSRVVAGYVAREPNASGAYTVRENEAHAWVEVYFPGYGWQRFDPTPGGANAVATPTPAPTAAPSAAATAAATPQALPETLQPTAPAPSATTGHGSILKPALIVIGALLAVLLLARLLWWWLGDERRAVLVAWSGVALAGRLAWRPRLAGETPREYAGAMVAARHAGPAAQDVALAQARARYGPPAAPLVLPPSFRRRSLRAVAGIISRPLLRLRWPTRD
jgi:transglutaminase-like putative cysteine protease